MCLGGFSHVAGPRDWMLCFFSVIYVNFFGLLVFKLTKRIPHFRIDRNLVAPLLGPISFHKTRFHE